ncbi:MAG: FAD-dependent oxidoreductase [Bacteroidetes bacterium]|nr:FAD-dependent oxidoreductase [Bacteroidota bacterium]
MLNRTINIISSYPNQLKTCVMGNEAIVRAAVEAGVNGVFSYPGTPSTEISEIFDHIYNFQHKAEYQMQYPEITTNKIYFEYSINEKIAMEKAIAYSIGNKSAMCVMKNVGMNVASDPLMSVTYQTIGGPLVVIVCDDPGCHSSSNEQDSRYWGPMANVPVFNPSTPSEAYKMVKQAFELSELIKLPVIVRTTTRVSHTRSTVHYGEINEKNRNANFERLPEHINIPARTATAHTRLLNKLNSDVINKLFRKNIVEHFNCKTAKIAIVTSGVATSYAQEIISDLKLENDVCLFEIGLIFPFPEKEIVEILKDKFTKLLILEELDPFIENQLRNIIQKNNLKINVKGKGFSTILPTGEFSLEIISKAIIEFAEIKSHENENLPIENYNDFLNQLPPRPPALCSGCPHRATFYLLKLAIPREQSELIMCGDIGCFGLGALPPLKMMDTINHMGMSISMAQGLYESFHDSDKDKKVVALLGDGTFFHSGLTSLVNAVYTRANILVIIFDNRTIGMTGQQDNPGSSHIPKYKEIDIPPVLKGLGIEVVEVINPYNIRESYEKVEKAINHKGVSVIVSKAPCIYLPEFKVGVNTKRVIKVDPEKCNTCANHDDVSITCSRCYTPKNNLSRAKSKIMAKNHIQGEAQLCPANICNHGFFNSILEGSYKEAVEIVRDKMLFARTCGDVCHRPCELFSEKNNFIPIKLLKKSVSAIDDNFYDFTEPIKRAKNAQSKNKCVAIIGAGPAGLSAAYDLVQQGYKISIFEKDNKVGGMITSAIPSFRMDKKGFEYEAMQLEKMGVEFIFNTKIGVDISFENIAENFDSTIISTGLPIAKKLDLVEDFIPERNRLSNLDFLKNFNEGTCQLKPNSSILVIGGGNSAIDAARAAKKLDPQNKVVITCIETEKNMPAFAEEINHAILEGIEIINCSYVNNIEKLSNDRLKISLFNFDNKDKFNQDFICDYVITAIGQIGDSTVDFGTSIKVDENGKIINNNTKTKIKNVFVAGDICQGNNMSLIGAIASGKKAAVEVRKLLENYTFDYEGNLALKRLNNTNIPEFRTNNEIVGIDKTQLENYDLFQSCQKCNHCIDNFGCPAMVKVNGKVQIDLTRCTLCGLCIDVCPNNAISWVTEIENESSKQILI